MSAVATEYAKTVETYNGLVEKSRGGDKQARKDKAKVMQDVRAIEREAARNGQVLARAGAAIPRTVTERRRTIKESGVVRQTDSKQSLQEEYCRKFDDKKPVEFNGEKTTMRAFHSKRLLGR